MAKIMHTFVQVNAPANIHSASKVIYMVHEESAFDVLCNDSFTLVRYVKGDRLTECCVV